MTKRTFLLLACIYAWFGLDGAFAQSSTRIAPDCSVPFKFTATGRAPANGFAAGSSQTGCVGWVVVYNATGFSALSLRLESASDSSGVAGSWGAFSGSSVTLTGCGSTNPMTATTQTCLSINGYNPWVSVNLTTVTGTGSITGFLYGCRIDNCAALFQAAGGGGVTSDVNLKQVNGHTTEEGGTNGSLAVGGQAASGAADAGNPLKVGGSNGTNDYNLKVDSQGNNYNFLGCTNTAEVALSGTGYVEIVAGTAAQVIQVCKVLVTSVSGGNPTVNTFSVASATITSCASPTELSLYAGVTGVADDWGGALRSAAGKSICVSESVANSDKVTISYQKAAF